MQDHWVIKDKSFAKFITDEQIQHAIVKMAGEIDAEYQGKTPIFLIVLNGAFIFASDLIKKVTIDCEMAFVRLSSYKGTQSTGVVNEMLGVDIDLENRHIIIVEDIVDTGLTLQHFLTKIETHNPADVKIAACLVKPMAFKADYIVDFSCFSIPNDFVVGYGLDYDGLGRNSSDIYKLAE